MRKRDWNKANATNARSEYSRIAPGTRHESQMCQNAICSYCRSYINTIYARASFTFDLLNRSCSLFTYNFVRCLWQIEIQFFRMFFTAQLNFLYTLPKKERNKWNEIEKKEGRKENKCRRSTQSSRPINIAAIGGFDLIRITWGGAPTGCLVVSAWVGVTWRRRDTCDGRK